MAALAVNLILNAVLTRARWVVAILQSRIGEDRIFMTLPTTAAARLVVVPKDHRRPAEGHRRP